jgi:hypothetical protein
MTRAMVRATARSGRHWRRPIVRQRHRTQRQTARPRRQRRPPQATEQLVPLAKTYTLCGDAGRCRATASLDLSPDLLI